MTERYDRIAQSLHWLIALLIPVLWLMGENIENMAKGEPRVAFIALHISVGMVFATLLVLRVLWRVTHRPPASAPAPRALEIAAKAGHHALYLLMVLIPVLGILARLTHGRSVPVFNLFEIPTPFASNKALYEPLEGAHGLAANLLILLAIGHIVMALYHHFWMKDGLLKRMSPFGG